MNVKAQRKTDQLLIHILNSYSYSYLRIQDKMEETFHKNIHLHK